MAIKHQDQNSLKVWDSVSCGSFIVQFSIYHISGFKKIYFQVAPKCIYFLKCKSSIVP